MPRGIREKPIVIAGQRLMDANGFADWLAAVPVGSRICYFRGEFAVSVDSGIDADLIVLAALITRCAKDKRICLTQQRDGEFGFKYFATKCVGTDA